MIIIKIQGGLCNQLFQWAFGCSLSKKFNVKVYYDIVFFQSEQHLEPRTDTREFCLPNLLNKEVPLITQDIANEFHSKPQQVISESSSYLDFHYDDQYSYYFIGYWQNQEYIKDIRSNIISSIDFDADHSFDFNGSCSLHVRRGDYLKLLHKHPVQPREYYEKALEEINPSGNIFVFSDDIEWCKANLKFKNLIFMDGNSNVEDLLLMSMCKDNIIANSSFSWWAAWLNQNEDKRIVCPQKWFGDGQNESEIRLKEWNRI
jgi:hypothetical protein